MIKTQNRRKYQQKFNFRDFAFISSVKSRKFCEHIEPSESSIRVTEEGEQVAEIDYSDPELRGSEYMELEDNEMYLWLRVSNHHPDELMEQMMVSHGYGLTGTKCSER